MPDKPNDNKLVAMLERWGIIQKAGSDDETVEEASPAERPRTEADFRSMMGPSADDSAKSAPVTRQPVPGMMTPIIPSSQAQPSDSGQAQAEFERPRAQQQPLIQAEPVRTQPVGTQMPSALSRDQSAIRENDSLDDEPFVSRAEPAMGERPSASPTPENYADRLLDIDELYEALSIRSRRTDSIYLVEDYLHTLPDSLPDESRREIVTKIVNTSGFDFDRLMGDGVLRVKMLKEYAERFAQYTEKYVADRNAELDELDRQILRVRTLIENRRELHKKQFFTIEAEAQRLKDILTFISS